MLPVPNMQSWKGAWPKTYLLLPNAMTPNSRWFFFPLLYPAAPDNTILGIAGKSGFQKSDKEALGSCDKLINHLQIHGNIISSSIQAAQWKWPYHLSAKIDVLFENAGLLYGTVWKAPAGR